ncbi:MAG: hypothetical protein ACJLS3_08045 [Erythrobacter sp.]
MPERIDRLFSMPAARADRWRRLSSAAKAWAGGQGDQASTQTYFDELSVFEEYHAFPGMVLMQSLARSIAAGNAGLAAETAARVSSAILTKSYRNNPQDWEHSEDFATPVELLPVRRGQASRPYFEVLVVVAEPMAKWPALADEIRRLRRPEDAFVYEPVIVGSYEDALCAAMLNPIILSVIVYEGFDARSRHDPLVLRQVIGADLDLGDAEVTALRLCKVLKSARPDLDLYLCSDRDVERIAGEAASRWARRVFYAVEEPLEVHLAILEGVQDRYQSPFFDNLKKYAQRPIGTFHALPIARGKSVFKSDWIRDMGEFYGLNLFLAESSATTGGLELAA